MSSFSSLLERRVKSQIVPFRVEKMMEFQPELPVREPETRVLVAWHDLGKDVAV